MERILHRCIQIILAFPKSAIVASLLVCLVFLAGVPRFEIDASVKRYIGEESQVVAHLNFLESEYIEDSNILIMFKPDSGDVFTPEVLSAMAEMTALAWQVPNIRRVDSLTNFQHTQVVGDELEVSELVSGEQVLSAKEIARIRQIALNEPRLLGSLVDASGKVAAINLLFTVDLSNHGELTDTIHGVEEIKRAIAERYPGIEFYDSGFVYMMYEMTETAAEDAAKLYSLALILVLIFLAWFFASWRAALAVLLIGLLSVAVSVGFYGWIGGYLTPPTAMGTLMVLILGLADGIHVVKSAQRYLAQDCDTREAMAKSVISNFTPIAFTSITTIIGFMSFNFNDFVGIKLMGNYVAFGVMVAFVLSLTLLPALLCYCRLKPAKRASSLLSYRRLADGVIDFRRALLLVTGLILLVSAYGISLNTIDDSISRHLKPGHPFRASTRQIESDLTGSVPVIYSFSSDTENGIADPQFMAKVEEFVAWVRERPQVRYVNSYTDTMKQLNRDLNGGDPAKYQLPTDMALAAQYLLLYEMSLPYGLDLGNQLNMDKSATRVVLFINDLTLQEIKEFLQVNRQWLERSAPEFDSFANSSILSSNLTVEESIWNTLVGAFGALIIIALFLVFTFRAILPGVFCVISVIAPMVVTFGIWGLAVGVVDLPATLALCMVIAITVDFSIHFIAKELHGRRVLGYSAQDSIRYAFDCVGAPIVASTVALSAGFLVLVLGQFQFAARMGLLTALCIALSMLTVFTLLPPLLMLGGRNDKIPS